MSLGSTPPLGMRFGPADVTLQRALLQLVKGGPELQAIEAGEIDAIVDHASSNVILFPAARRALREVAGRAPAANREAATEASIANSLLAALPRAVYRRLLAAGLEPVTLTLGEVLYTPGAPIRHVYFPIDCLVTLLTTVDGRLALEVGLVGREGMAGIPLALGIDVSPVRARVLGTGAAMRMEATSFRKELVQCMPLQRVLNRYTHARMVQINQTNACNNFHSVQARLARWLLVARDRVRSDEFRLTHELLAEMLGIRRVGVTNAAGDLQKRKLIRYSHGYIRIVDRKGLAAVSCECYTAIKRLYDSA